MTQNDLNRAVARATGETVTEIARRGFQPLLPDVPSESVDNEAPVPRKSYRVRRVRQSQREPVAV